jgi:hypothetical protein
MITKIAPGEQTPTLSFIFGPSVVPYQPSETVQILSQYRGLRLKAFEIEEAKRQIAELRMLANNWDGYGAIPIQENTKNNALAAADQVLQWAPFPADIAPNPNGTISLEWETEYGTAHLEIGLTRYSFYMDRRGGTTLGCDGAADDIVPQLGVLIFSSLFPPPPGTAAVTSVADNVQSTNRGI